MKLNLTANNQAEKLIKEYLEKNANDILSNKINNGTPFTKDGKQFINKKTLSGFMKYANEQARKMTEKGQNCACIEDNVVYGWALHYFEEDEIEEKLYTLDGTEYVSTKTVNKPKTTTTHTIAVKQEPKPQMSFFDMLNEKKEEKVETPEEVDEEPTEEDIKDALKEMDNPTIDDEVFNDTPIVKEEKPKLLGSPVYQNYMKIQKEYPDCIIAYRLGDFYEIFGQNAITVAGELDLTLTGRDCGLEERVSMVGYPYHIADKYVSKLIENGHKVAIVENLDNVKVKQQEEPEKHWVNETTYIDKDGVVHEVVKESDSSMDSAVIAIWKNLLGDDLII